MKFLLDQGLPRGAALVLQGSGFEVAHVADIGMSRATDEEIIAHARREKRVVVTLDADFHALMATSNEHSPSVIRFRIEGLKAQSLADVLRIVAEVLHGELETGVLATVDEKSIRFRRLPIAQ